MSGGTVTCQDDAMAQLSRGAGTSADRDRYMAHLRVCDDCYAAWVAARSFERTGGVQPGDERMVSAAVDRALAAARVRPRLPAAPRWRLRPAFVVAGTIILAGAAASAGMFVHRRNEVRRRAAEAASLLEKERPVRHGGHVRRLAEVSPAPVDLVPAPVDVAPPAVDLTPAPPPAAVSPAHVAAPPVAPAAPRAAIQRAVATAPPASARELFAAATAARRAGRRDEAIAAFRSLERDFAGSTEATVSLVSLAQLLSERAQPADALALFEAYLTRAPGGPLAPEALAGKARMLDRLGRAPEADATRREIRARFPASPYAPSP